MFSSSKMLKLVFLTFMAVTAVAAQDGDDQMTASSSPPSPNPDPDPLPPMCSDIPVNESEELQQFSCQLPINATAAAAYKEGLALLELHGLAPDATTTCNRDPPRNGDARRLCGQLPNPIDLPPAYSSTICACEVFTQSQAQFAACNCDYCSGAVLTNPQTACNAIYSTCVNNRNKGGTRTYNRPNSFTALYRTGSSDPSAIGSNC